MTDAHKTLLDSGYERGCPLTTIALAPTADDTVIRDATVWDSHPSKNSACAQYMDAQTLCSEAPECIWRPARTIPEGFQI